MIAIVGGGISGLALAHHLAARDLPFQLLESSNRPGGVIRSGRIEGHVLDWGPQRMRLTAELSSLVDQLGLRDRLVTAPPGLPLFVYRTGRLRRVPFSAVGLLRSDLLSLRGRLRLLLEPLTAGPRDDETVAACFTRKIGREAYEVIAGPLYGGLYASDPADMLVGLSLGRVLHELGVGRSFALPLLRRGGAITPPPACSFDEGMNTLTDALWRRHAQHGRLGAPVCRITRHGAGYALHLESEVLHAERVVLATPASTAALLLHDVAPDAAARIARLNYNPLAVVHLLADNPLRGLGYQVSFGEPLITRGVTWNDSLFGRTGVYTAYLGGAHNPWVAQEPVERVGSIAVAEFRTVMGVDARVLSVEQEWMPAWDRSWSALESLELPAGVHLHANWAGRPGIPGRLAGARQLAERLDPRAR
ncbi:MAG: FAD-dependent oxidoreductase [Gemmatimonadota bacterium]